MLYKYIFARCFAVKPSTTPRTGAPHARRDQRATPRVRELEEGVAGGVAVLAHNLGGWMPDFPAVPAKL